MNPRALLSDIEILERLVAADERCIFVSPLVDPRHQLGPSSLDLRLGSELKIPRTTAATHIDLTRSAAELETQIATYFDLQRVAPEEAFVLHPGEFALAGTLEFIKLPRDIAARLEGRSSLGRLGIKVHATAGFVDPGFEGTLTFELSNAGRLPVTFFPGLRLGQLCFFEITEVQIGYTEKSARKYTRALDAQLSRIHRDPELASR